jgi:predicted PurR-regulated permease PerM
MDDVNTAPRSWDLTRIVLAVMTIGGLTLASFWVLRPFLLAGIWATMIVVATWPALRMVQARLWGSRSLAVAAMTLVMILVIAAPLATAVLGIADRTDDIVEWFRALAVSSVPPPPEWVDRIPMVGRKIAREWALIAASSSEDLLARGAPYLRAIARWVLGELGAIGTLLVQMLLAVSISAILYAKGEMAAAGVLAFARRLAGPAGERVTVLAASAIRAVALGIVVTALVQSIIGGIGLVIVGVPYALLLTSLMFLLGVAQIGAIPVLLGAVIWAYWSSGTFWGTLMLVWAIGTGSLDNVLRPILIKRGADLPLLLIFAGVVGGLLAFGLIGLFVGPVVLSVTYTLLEAWVNQGAAPSDLRNPAMVESRVRSEL